VRDASGSIKGTAVARRKIKVLVGEDWDGDIEVQVQPSSNKKVKTWMTGIFVVLLGVVLTALTVYATTSSDNKAVHKILGVVQVIIPKVLR
jgi:hypothetical protein